MSCRIVSIWQTQASLKSQVERAEAKLVELKAAKGTDAMEAAQANYHKMDQVTNVRPHPSDQTCAASLPLPDTTPSNSSSSASLSVWVL